ncbi:MAG: VacB/RNase II family 3'-5' exoribonuclease [Bryobacterales bacterium]|nr:VacB/RNase II family 3'-5' exoribonuclease [Bryobacterales bacterium]
MKPVRKPASRLISGRLQVHRDGFGFVTPDQPIEGLEGDIFLPPDAAAKAMHGDTVGIRIVRFNPRDGRAEGDITKVIARGHTSVVGKFLSRKRGYFVQPHDERLRQWIHIPEKLAVPKGGLSVDRIGAKPLTIKKAEDLDGMIVTAEIIDYPQEDENPVGRIVEVLGKPDDFGVDVEIMIRKHGIPHHFPPQVIEQARSMPAEISDGERAGREDFRSYDIVTIDGETARDFDDAVWVDRLPNGNWGLQVHIADVSHYVRPGTPIDAEAAMRGTSVYFPDRAVPMLPVELSTDICSLRPHVDRLVMSAILEIDNHGDVVSQRFTRGVIRSAERMTYTAVHKILEGDPELREQYAPLADCFDKMRELALILNRKRVRRGSIDFDLPEPILEFNEFGEMIDISRSDRNIAHRIIEEFMLAANEAVANHITEAGMAMVYRVHETPDPNKVIAFEEIARQFGATLGIKGIGSYKFHNMTRHADGRKSRRDVTVTDTNFKVTSRHYQKLIAAMEGKPEERILAYLMLRSLKQARYSEENLGHFALASDCYTHFTSPIRRYPDLLVHRALGALLDHAGAPYSEEQLKHLADQSSFTERRSSEAERELVEWKKVKFMVDHVGEEFDSLIISTTKYGFFVELAEFFVEGLVPIDTLPGERYGYEENTRRIIGQRTRTTYSIGDKARVRLDRVDGVERRLQFSVVTDRKKGRKR